ncbi:type 1 glutamine amidotransferase [Streptomyces albidus (ex Kaewkla and Franco 2022)]|uniref:type 1 glutamine amidotransferase n=1 Tax=Streptomyces albidus (ex Kaewkla and Franco 2022) TaxID=722709 RepID=UPI0015EE3AE2|nr:type 1 glutamine amidotransferase [Streptomyces albidus (ex Kaewkla and Franco 2022)]
MAARALVVQNTPSGGPGRLGSWLEEHGLTLDVVHAYAGDPLPEKLARHQALLVMGGGYMPDADDRAPWLARTRELAGQALESGVPALGVCLGGQLLAHVAGGTVRAEHGLPEAGSTALTLRPEASDDLLFRGLPSPLNAIEHRVDAITELPPGARWLARSERCPIQAFRIGEGAWGLQFHPEATARNVEGWDAEKLREQGFNREELIRAAERDEAGSTATWRELARRFAAFVARTAPPGPPSR